MKKKLLYSLIASMSMISIGAYAAPGDDASTSALTTKGYVDAGLKYVYDVAEGTENGTVKTLKNTVGNAVLGTSAQTVTGAINELNTTINGDGVNSDGLVGDVADLSDDVADLQDALGDGNGNLIDVSTLKETVDGLSANSAIDGANTGVRISDKKIQLDVGNASNTTYVYKTDSNGNGTWQAMEVEDSWNPGFLTTP